MKKISKAEFLRIAEMEGLIFLGAKGLTLEEATLVCEQNLYKCFRGADRDPCTVKGQTITRHGAKDSNLDYLQDQTTVITFDDGVIIQSF